MAVPEMVRDRLGDEEIRARIALGGDDELVVTRDRSLLYRGDGLLSGESVEEHPHDAERVVVDEGRRKSTIHLDRGIDGDSEFTIPTNKLDEALQPLLGGVFAVDGLAETDETVEEVYRLGELTIVITEGRLVKHVGDAVWDEEFEEFAFADVTGLDVEEGEVSSQIIVDVDGRPERIKTPSDDARAIRERIEGALLSYHDVGTYEEFRELVAPDEEDEGSPGGSPQADIEAQNATVEDHEDDEEPEDEEDTELVFGEDATGPIGVRESTAASSGESGDVADEVTALREVVERQNELLEEQQQTIARLIEELRQGR